MSHVDIEVQSTWEGRPLLDGEHARIRMRVDPGNRALELGIDASFHDDPAPDVPAGCVDGLWEFEVVELFLLGDDERYLEIELGPHGHFLMLRLAGRRQIVDRDLPLDLRVQRVGSRWHGETSIPLEWLPSPVRAMNAYAMHGVGPARRYLAAHPVPGPEPDFHRLECFAPLSLSS